MFPRGLGPQHPKIFHTNNHYAPAMLELLNLARWRTMTSRRILGVDVVPTQGSGHPRTHVWSMCHTYTQTAELEVAKFDTLTHQGQTINTPHPPPPPRGGSKAPIFLHTCVIPIISQVLQYLSGWVTTIRRHPLPVVMLRDLSVKSLSSLFLVYYPRQSRRIMQSVLFVCLCTK